MTAMKDADSEPTLVRRTPPTSGYSLISRAMRASVQTKAGDRASLVLQHSSTAACDSAQVPIAHTFDTLGEYFEINPPRFIDLRRIALRRRGRLLCR